MEIMKIFITLDAERLREPTSFEVKLREEKVWMIYLKKCTSFMYDLGLDVKTPCGKGNITFGAWNIDLYDGINTSLWNGYKSNFGWSYLGIINTWCQYIPTLWFKNIIHINQSSCSYFTKVDMLTDIIAMIPYLQNTCPHLCSCKMDNYYAIMVRICLNHADLLQGYCTFVHYWVQRKLLLRNDQGSISGCVCEGHG